MNDKWAFTFGNDHVMTGGFPLWGGFCMIPGTYEEAREIMDARRGNKWSMVYREDEIKVMIPKYNLTEYSLDEVSLLPEQL
jgi:hypothetical protein